MLKLKPFFSKALFRSSRESTELNISVLQRSSTVDSGTTIGKIASCKPSTCDSKLGHPGVFFTSSFLSLYPASG